MLTRIILDKYRCFKHASLTCHCLSIIVGKNNAGKSTVIEALRIVAYVVKHYKTNNYKTPPEELHLPLAQKGLFVPINPIDINLRTIVYQYLDQEGDSATITAIFSNKARIIVHCNSKVVFANIYDPNGILVTSKAKANSVQIPSINILPQINPLRDSETRLSDHTIIDGLNTRLSSRHFRNELWHFRNCYYNRFKELAERTWRGLRIQELAYDYGDENPITLLVYDEGFSAEIGLMGSGLQMWLQIIWFLSRCSEDSIVILDEPDVYMHPEMQDTVLRLVQAVFPQVLIATHSAEIISRVDAHDIVQIDKSARTMKYASDSAAAQAIINIIGSSQNLALIGLASSRKCIFVEGKDISLLAKFQKSLRPLDTMSIRDIPSVALGGWSRFDETLGASRLFYEQSKGQFQTFCILDRDYHPQEVIDSLQERALENHLTLFVWDKKELESYTLCIPAILRISRLPEIQHVEFLKLIEDEVDVLFESVIIAYTNEFFMLEPDKGAGHASILARKYVESRWTDLETKLGIVNGKEANACVNRILRSYCKKSCSRSKLISEIDPSEIDPQMSMLFSMVIGNRV